MRAAEPAPATLAALDGALSARAAGATPLLAFRLPALERTAWRRGLRAARDVERRATDAFAAAVARILRPEDAIAHDRGADTFVAALVAPTRAGHDLPAPVDVRAASARIAAAIEGVTALEVDAGWMRYDPHGAVSIHAAVDAALVRGAQERERYGFFSALGHELRTPLASIRGYLETLLADDTDRAARTRFIRIAHGESLRLARLLDGMFEISLLDLSAGSMPPGTGSLDHVLAGAADASAALAAQHGVTLAIAPVPAVTIAIDADRFMLALINVIANAVKHGRPCGRVEVAANLASRTASIVIDDDGPGIAGPDRERMFAFGGRGPTRAEGSGIGLALVRMLLERAGGRVEIGDSPLGGARFTLTVPRSSALQRGDRFLRYAQHGDGFSERP